MTIQQGKVALSRPAIADAALALTNEVGLQGLSMRKLGAELGVEAMALYHYVKNKDDLLDAILERLYLRIELPTHLDDGDWEGAIRLGLHALRSVLLSHPAAIELFTSRSAPSDEAFGVLSWAYERFGYVGLSPKDTLIVVHLIVSYAIGSVASELGSLAQVHAGQGNDAHLASHPFTLATVEAGARVSPDEVFDGGIDLLIAALRARFSLPD